MLNKLMEEYKKWELQVNKDKAQYMVIGGEGKDIQSERGVIKNVTEYEYLGVTVTADGKDENDILKKVSKGRKMINALHSILWNTN